MMVGSYGVGDRPVIKTGNSACIKSKNPPVSHVSFIGIECVPNTRGGGDEPQGVRWMASGSDILFEDMFIHEYRNNIVVQTFYGPINDVKIRKSIITDSYSASAHSHVIFSDGVNGLLIEGNFLDHNGWNESLSGAPLLCIIIIYTST